MTPRRFFLLPGALALAMLVTAVPKASADAVGQLDQAMACTNAFSPQDVLTALQNEGWIATEPILVIDGVPAFPILKPLQLHGLTVKFVAGWAPEGELFFRSPGTPPGTFISVAFEAAREALERKLGPANPQDDPPHRLISDEIVAYGYQKHPGLIEAECQLTF